MAGVARLQDLRVAPQPTDLLLERLHLSSRTHRVTQQVAQVSQQPACLVRILGHQPCDGIERVEEEVGLEVRAQLGELRLRAKLVTPIANPTRSTSTPLHGP